jgi:hypothetical protein
MVGLDLNYGGHHRKVIWRSFEDPRGRGVDIYIYALEGTSPRVELPPHPVAQFVIVPDNMSTDATPLTGDDWLRELVLRAALTLRTKADQPLGDAMQTLHGIRSTLAEIGKQAQYPDVFAIYWLNGNMTVCTVLQTVYDKITAGDASIVRITSFRGGKQPASNWTGNYSPTANWADFRKDWPQPK